VAGSAEGVSGAPTGSPQSARAREASAAPKCAPASDLPAPPRKIRDGKPELSDIGGIRTHAGVLVFDVTIVPSGSVTNVRRVNDIDTRHPWPTLADRWRSAISDWRYEPAAVNNKPFAVCMTVEVIIHVM
jgi:hypothetical protein